MLACSFNMIQAQDYISSTRGDEVGPRSLLLNEETFLNILSFNQPLESIQPWLASRSGYRVALGSLTSRDLWLEQELKHTAVVNDSFSVSGIARQGVDLDTAYTFIQPSLEYRLSKRWEIFAPTVLTVDKGGLDGGIGLRLRDPEAGIEYMQLVWMRADFLFNNRSREYQQSKGLDPADILEVQTQGSFLESSRTSLKMTYQLHSTVRLVELGKDEEFERLSAWFLHKYDLNEQNRIFFEYEHEIVDEKVNPFNSLNAEDAFQGDRHLSRARVDYQRDLDEGGVRRVRGGGQFLRFNEDEKLYEVPSRYHKMLRRESILYAGYRIPLGTTDEVSLETMIYLDWLKNRDRFPYSPINDERAPAFQGKINFLFSWVVTNKVDFVLNPSFELDTVGWGGGGIQLRYHF
ncbi:MAG: hypothetical protein ABIK28_05530 [Planctomycetota bacterium]